MRAVTPRRAAQAMTGRRRRAAVLAERRALLGDHYRFGAHGRRRTNVTLVLQSATRPTSSTFIRVLGPLSRDAFGPVGLDVVDEKSLWVSPRTDVCIVQRTAFSRAAAARRFLDEARRVGCVVVVDTDDAFASLDPGHPQYARQVERASILERVMQEADEVWVSTEVLLASRPPGTARVVRNTLDLDLWAPRGPRPSRPDDDPLQILYMGTRTHDGDFAVVADVLDRLHAAHPGSFSVTMVGVAKELPDRPWMQVAAPPVSAYPQFVPWLVTTGPFDVGLSPLVDSPFNRAKSDVKCLDYLALGAWPVVSDVEPYRVPELDQHVQRVTNDPAHWYAALERLVVDRARLRREADGRRAAASAYLSSSRSADHAAAVLRERVDALRAADGRRPPRP